MNLIFHGLDYKITLHSLLSDLLSFPQFEDIEVKIKNKKYKMKVLKITKTHRKELRLLYESWRKLSVDMEKFGTRGVNIHESISEGAFALVMHCPRVVKVHNGVSSYDNINLKTKKRIQVKATSVKEDLTSFGPRSEYDELYFLDFYRAGKFDGKFDIYKINPLFIENAMVNKKLTVKEFRKTGKRPHLSIMKKIIEPKKLKKIKTGKI